MPITRFAYTHLVELISSGELKNLVAKRLGDEVPNVLNTYVHPKFEDYRRLSDAYIDWIKSV